MFSGILAFKPLASGAGNIEDSLHRNLALKSITHKHRLAPRRETDLVEPALDVGQI